MREARCANLAAVGAVGAVRYDIYSEFAFGSLDCSVAGAGWHVVAF